MDKTLGTPEFIIQENLYFGRQTEKDNYFVKYYHTSANIQSPRLDDLMHVFVKVLALLWDSNCSKTVIYAIYKKFLGEIQYKHLMVKSFLILFNSYLVSGPEELVTTTSSFRHLSKWNMWAWMLSECRARRTWIIICLSLRIVKHIPPPFFGSGLLIQS